MLKPKIFRAKHGILLLILCIVLSMGIPLSSGVTSKMTQMEGRVVDSNGEPVANASIYIWSIQVFLGPNLKAETMTDSEGFFSAKIWTPRDNVYVFAHYDDPDTESVEYFPAFSEIDPNIPSHTLNFTLEPTATIYIDGPIRLFDSSSNIEEYQCAIIDIESQTIKKDDFLDLIYGTQSAHDRAYGPHIYSLNNYIKIDENIVLVNGEEPVQLQLITYYVERYQATWWRFVRGQRIRRIWLEDGQRFSFSPGEVVRFNLGKYTTISDITRLDSLYLDVESEVETREAGGFYAIAEREDLANIQTLRENAEDHYENGFYEGAYVELRQAYLLLKDLSEMMQNQIIEASVSLKELVAFIAVTSITTAYLLFEFDRKRLIFSCLLYGILLTLLYVVHPGKAFVSIESYLKAAATSLVAILIVIKIFPRFLKERRREKGIPFFSLLSSILSMAKRNLLRRRLRFALTFISIMILSSSFVVLTSASMEYGLISTPQKWAQVKTRGILIKQFAYWTTTSASEGRFQEITSDIYDWIGVRDGVEAISRKAENFAKLEPLGMIQEYPIIGIMGIEPATELTMPDIQSSIIEGGLDIEAEGAIMVSDVLFKEAGLAIGNTLVIGETPVTVTGVFNKDIRNVIDLDGMPIIPKTQVNIVQDEGAPLISTRYCDYESIIVSTVETALELNRDVRVSRLALTLREDVDPVNMAKGFALERGVSVWGSTGSVLYSAKIGEQFIGKGLPIIIPCVIVILNVIVAVLNSMYERKGEINILSSVGLNPAHVTGIFVSESLFTGIISGGFGYLLGMGFYPIMSYMSSAPAVRYKISAIWSLGAVGFAVLAAVTGAFFAMKRAVVLTPSLSRHWSVTKKPIYFTEPWVVPVPIKITLEEFPAFIDFIERRLTEYSRRRYFPNITSFTRSEEVNEMEELHSYTFWYRDDDAGVNQTLVRCSLQFKNEKGEDVYTSELIIFGSGSYIQRAGNFVRNLVIEWKTLQHL